MQLLAILSILLASFASSTCKLPSPTSDYANHIILVEPDIYILYWNYTNEDILFETHVKNNGWSAFGLSPNGGMDNSDVAVTWLNDNGTINFSDRHISGRQVKLDKVQNWFSLNATFTDGYLISKFTRKIKLCDKSGEDLDIEMGTPHVIYAWSQVFNKNEITYHGHENRGSRVVPLISSLNSESSVDFNKTESVEYRVNTTIPSKDTEYFCQMFELPEEWMEKKRHLLRYETLFTKGNEKFLHHFVMYECEESFETVFLKNNNTVPTPGSCFPDKPSETNEWRKASKHCSKISLVWAVGGSTIQDFPNDIAYPLGRNASTSKYFYLEIHYDNPAIKKGVRDFSGIKFYATTEYRNVEFGIYTHGAVSNTTGIVIPPGAVDFRYESTCHKDCFSTLFDTTEEVKVFATMPHTHLHGTAVSTTVVQEGKEVAFITNNQNYDFNYQYMNFLTNPVKLTKNDTLRTTCVYNTEKKDRFVYGGFSTREEMCLNFIWYYPRNTGSSKCSDLIDYKVWNKFLIELNSTSEVVFEKNLTRNQDVLDLRPVGSRKNKELVGKFQDFFDNANRTQICTGPSGKFSLTVPPARIVPFADELCVKSKGKNIYL